MNLRSQSEKKMLISEFYAGRNIFVTGGSGFLGKALIEKLLYSCSTLANLYVLMRGKRGKGAEERLRDILETSVFDRLRRDRPETFRKVHAIEGDCSELGLGISEADLEKLKSVSIVFHVAASVRFDDHLRNAILLNTRGTFELVKIAKRMSNLVSFVHVSTAFCNPDERIVEEKIYPPLADWRDTIKLAETFDTEILDVFNLKYGNFQPNTYTFTKSLSEQLINEYSKELPMVVFRPSVVVASIEEPAPGWIDNFNGPIGMLVGCGTGIFRTNYGNPDNILDFIPVDVVIRAIVVACYKRGLERTSFKEHTKMVVYNCTSATFKNQLSIGELLEIGKVLIKRNPFENMLWKPGGNITRCYFWNLIRHIFLQLLPAIFVDSMLHLAKAKPFLLKIQRRIHYATVALDVFIKTSWTFKDANFQKLDLDIPAEEKSGFEFLHFKDMDPIWFAEQGIRGAKQYLLKEPPYSTDGARMRYKVLEFLDYTLKFGAILLLARFAVPYAYKTLNYEMLSSL